MTDRRVAARAVWILTTCTALALIGDGTMYAALPAVFPAVGVTAVQVGVLLSINRLVRPPLNMLTGWLVTRVDPHWPYMLGLAIGACSTLGYGLVQGFWPLLLLRALWGLAWALVAVSAYAMVLDITAPEFRGRYAGIYHSFSFFGGALGAMGGGLIVDSLGFSRAMVALGLLSASALGLVLFLPHRAVRRAQASPPAPGRVHSGMGAQARAWRTSLKGLDARLGLILGLNFCERLFFAGLFYGTLSFYLAQVLPGGVALGPWALGIASLSGALFFARNLISVLTSPFFGHLSDRLGDRTLVLMLGEVLGVAGLVLLAVDGGLATIVAGVALTALAYGIVSPMLVSWMGDLTRQGGRGSIVGAYQTMGDLGSGLGPLVAYPLMALWGPSPVYLVSAVLLSGTVPLILWARRRGWALA